ncbi:O-antigen ligase family protein [Veronia pacifica]|nr:O-antigen ligase family protein [Veronia pacifica]
MVEYIEILRGTYSVSKTIFGVINVDPKKITDYINQGFIRPSGLSIDPNFMAGYSGLCIIYLFGVYKNKSTFSLKRWTFALPLFFPAFVLLSRTAIFSILITLLIILILSIFGLYRGRKHSLNQLTLLGFSVVSVVFINVVITQPELLENILRRFSVNDGSASQRMEYIKYYLSNNSLSSMFIGGGPYSSGYILGKEFFGDNFVWAPESAYLSILIDYGILGFTFFLGVIFYTSLKLYVNRDSYFPVYIYLCVMPVAYNFMGDRIFLYLITAFSVYAFKYSRFNFE